MLRVLTHTQPRTGDAKPGVTEITVYTHSTLGLGQEAAFASHERKLRSDGGTEDPCAPVGLDARHVYGSAGTPELKPLTPRGNFTRCVNAVVGLLGLDDPCPHERCGMKGSYLPPAIRGEMLATENFLLHRPVPGSAGASDDSRAGGRGRAGVRRGVDVAQGAHLKDPAASEDETFAEDESSLARYCFSASLAVAQLSFGLKLPKVAKIRFSNAVGGKAVDWAMGAAIAFTAGAVDAEEEWLLGPVSGWGGTDGGINAILFGLFDWRVLAVGVVASVGLIAWWRRSRHARMVELRIRAKVQAWGSAGRLPRSEGTFGSLTGFTKSPAKAH